MYQQFILIKCIVNYENLIFQQSIFYETSNKSTKSPFVLVVLITVISIQLRNDRIHDKIYVYGDLLFNRYVKSC